MKSLFIKITICLTLIGFSFSSYAGVVVIVHSSNGAALDQGSISKIYLGKSSKFPGGGKVVPIALKADSAATGEFNSKVLGRDAAQLKAYWSKLVFTGKGVPPKEMGSDQEVIDLIASNPNMIGFVSDGADTSSVKVAATF